MVFETVDIRQRRTVIPETGNRQSKPTVAPDEALRVSKTPYREGDQGVIGKLFRLERQV